MYPIYLYISFLCLRYLLSKNCPDPPSLLKRYFFFKYNINFKDFLSTLSSFSFLHITYI